MTDEDGRAGDQDDGRIAWARERTLLSRERTYAAWVRTGLGTTGLGIAIPRLVGEDFPRHVGAAVAIVLLVCSAGIHVFSFWTAHRTLARLREQGIVGLPVTVFALFTAALVAVNAALIVLIWRG